MNATRLTTPLLAASLALAACGGKEPTTNPLAVDAGRASSTLPVPSSDASGSTGLPTPDDERDTVTAAAEDTVTATVAAIDTVEAPAEPEGDDWLVWFEGDGVYHTRWIRVHDGDYERLAEVDAPVLSDGARLWRLEREDPVVPVKTCDCEEGGPDCPVELEVAVPSVTAVDLESGARTRLREIETDLTSHSVATEFALTGGVGALVFTRESHAGDFCGANYFIGEKASVFDLAAGSARKDALAELRSRLPDALAREAAVETRPTLIDCPSYDGLKWIEGLDGTDKDPKTAPTAAREALDAQLRKIAGDLKLRRLFIGLDDAGEVQVRWTFGVWTGRHCTGGPEYVDGNPASGFVSGAGAVGLNEAPPAGVLKALKELGASDVVGWSRLTLEGAARAAAFDRFTGVGLAKWPPAVATQRERGATPAPPPATVITPAQKRQLEAGRRATRAKRYDEALRLFDDLVAGAPGFAVAWSERGYARLLAGDLDGAEADIQRALTLHDSHDFQAACHYNLGQIAELRGDRAAARAAYARSVELRPNATVQAALDRLSGE